jgi:hypothetical protein
MTRETKARAVLDALRGFIPVWCGRCHDERMFRPTGVSYAWNGVEREYICTVCGVFYYFK